MQHFDITELEDKSGVSRRAIHYYVTEGVIPPAIGQGRAAFYDETHLLRLRLVGQLKSGSHLRLDGISEVLERLNLEEMRQWLIRLERGESSARALIAAVFTAPARAPAGEPAGTSTPADRTTTPADRTTAPTDRTTAPTDRSTRPADGTAAPTDRTTTPGSGQPAVGSSSDALPRIPDSPPQKSHLWERFPVVAGVEFHLHGDLPEHLREYVLDFADEIRRSLK